MKWWMAIIMVALLAPLTFGQDTAETAQTGDTAPPAVEPEVIRTGLHDKIEAAHLVVHAEVTASAGVTVKGGKRRWVQTLEVLEVFHEDHDRTALTVGDSISFFSWYDDAFPALGIRRETAARLPVGDAAVYFLMANTYTDLVDTTQEVWTAQRDYVGDAFDTTKAGSVVAPVDYGGTTGLVAGVPPDGRSVVRDDPDQYDWITQPFDGGRTLSDLRIDPDTVAADGMPWVTFLTRTRTAAGDL